MRRILLSMLLLALPGVARAGDFTGFYAGINAGYARGHEHDRSTNESPLLIVKPGADLPPSARDAALALHRSEPGRVASPSGR
ncbi:MULTISPECIES: hypothetical protein [unclassified Methylobacterium]|jgi:hypothetical protein|uniref:hypothetical protein n=1 Tax=unclassified Methylobacterium TaxID=2615210 RepID=UPI001354A2CB|nr:hypothetical protein [Methylobacterium sp. 2A]MWV24186.1 hypothetical protein [Methylobacterium sp. 2A]